MTARPLAPFTDPGRARRFVRSALVALAAQRDHTAQYIHEAAQEAHELGLTYAEIADALGISSGHAWHIAHNERDYG